jgi:hypothetical protein
MDYGRRAEGVTEPNRDKTDADGWWALAKYIDERGATFG